MTPLGWFRLAMLFMRVANWAARKVDEQTWKSAGRAEAMAEQTAAITRAVNIRTQAEAETSKMTPEDILRELEGNKELRD